MTRSDECWNCWKPVLSSELLTLSDGSGEACGRCIRLYHHPWKSKEKKSARTKGQVLCPICEASFPSISLMERMRHLKKDKKNMSLEARSRLVAKERAEQTTPKKTVRNKDKERVERDEQFKGV